MVSYGFCSSIAVEEQWAWDWAEMGRIKGFQAVHFFHV